MCLRILCCYSDISLLQHHVVIFSVTCCPIRGGIAQEKCRFSSHLALSTYVWCHPGACESLHYHNVNVYIRSLTGNCRKMSWYATMLQRYIALESVCMLNARFSDAGYS